jgi:hypothetical protein
MRGLGVKNNWDTKDGLSNKAHLAHINANKGSTTSFTTNKVVNSPKFTLGRVCTRCSGRLWWFRYKRVIKVAPDVVIDTGKGEWLCARCHPKPEG